MSAESLSVRRLWAFLPLRLILFAAFQGLFALGYALAGADSAWSRSAAWWPAVVTLGNLVTLAVMVACFRREGLRFWDLFRIDRAHLKGDLLVLLVALLITGPVAMLPNTWLATALFGDSLTPMRQFIVPLPPVGVLAAVVTFPLTQGLAELPFYFGFVMPRLGRKVQPWAAYALAALFLGLQHLAVPLRFEPAFLLWRGLMFLPFAFLIGLFLQWRPRLLPYFAVVHVLIDFATGVFYLMPPF
jgi:membrane protease YdiL (CAAX protease family)